MPGVGVDPFPVLNTRKLFILMLRERRYKRHKRPKRRREVRGGYTEAVRCRCVSGPYQRIGRRIGIIYD